MSPFLLIAIRNWNDSRKHKLRRLNICLTLDPFQTSDLSGCAHKLSRRAEQWEPTSGCLLIDDEWHFNEPNVKGVRSCLISFSLRFSDSFRNLLLPSLKQFLRSECYLLLRCFLFPSRCSTIGRMKTIRWNFFMELFVSLLGVRECIKVYGASSMERQGEKDA